MIQRITNNPSQCPFTYLSFSTSTVFFPCAYTTVLSVPSKALIFPVLCKGALLSLLFFLNPHPPWLTVVSHSTSPFLSILVSSNSIPMFEGPYVWIHNYVLPLNPRKLNKTYFEGIRDPKSTHAFRFPFTPLFNVTTILLPVSIGLAYTFCGFISLIYKIGTIIPSLTTVRVRADNNFSNFL